MNKLLKFIDGNKTYITIILTAVCVVLKAKGIEIPEYVWQLLGLAGFGSVRSAWKKLEVKK